MLKNIQEFPLALGTGIVLQTKCKNVGHYSTLLNVPEGVVNQWLEGAEFVRGRRQYSNGRQTSWQTLMESGIIGGTGEGPGLTVKITHRQIVCEQNADQIQVEHFEGFFDIERRSRFLESYMSS